MKNCLRREDRLTSFGHSSKGDLPVTLLILLALLPVLTVFCAKKPERGSPGETPERTSLFELRLRAARNFDLVDVFIYEDTDLLELEAYGRWELPPGREAEVCFELSPGDKRVIAIANSPYEFNLEAAARYSAMEEFTVFLRDDNPSRPLLAGATQFNSAEPYAAVEMSSHLCRIDIGEIGGAASTLEDLRFILSDYAVCAEPLRASGFYPEEFSSDTAGLKGIVWESRETLEPGDFCGTSLYCYPNESDAKPTTLSLEYRENGIRRTASKSLGRLKSGEVRLESWELR